MAKKVKRCERCNGSGEVYDMVYTGDGARVEAKLVPCPRCTITKVRLTEVRA